MKRRVFTLLEVMVAFALLAIVSGAVGFSMRSAIQKKKFRSDIERLKAKMAVSQKLAIADEIDWTGLLKKEGKGWVFETFSDGGKKLSPLHFGEMEIYFKGKKLRDLKMEFFASGHTEPSGIFLFVRDASQMTWNTSELFLREEGH